VPSPTDPLVSYAQCSSFCPSYIHTSHGSRQPATRDRSHSGFSLMYVCMYRKRVAAQLSPLDARQRRPQVHSVQRGASPPGGGYLALPWLGLPHSPRAPHKGKVPYLPSSPGRAAQGGVRLDQLATRSQTRVTFVVGGCTTGG
jgi:hypothetical protein